MDYTAAVITVSDSCSRGENIDTSGPRIAGMLSDAGYKVVYTGLVPDDKPHIEAELSKCADELQIDLILTTGGTGFSTRDVTPEATRAVIDREAPGIPEVMRWESLKITPRAMLSRSVAGLRGTSLIINLPGSEKAAAENLAAVIDTLEHALRMVRGGGHGAR
jgi:molybdopterin adenylyltransferase